MKKYAVLSICLISLLYINGCSELDHSNTEGSINELGNYISFEKVSTATEFELLDNVKMSVTGMEQVNNLMPSETDDTIIYPEDHGELLVIVAIIKNQSDDVVDLNNFLKCKEGTVFRIDEEYYPALNFAVKDESNIKAMIKPDDEKTIYIYTEVPVGKVSNESLIEAYLTYGRELEPSCALKIEDLDTDTTKKGFHFQLQRSTSAENFW